MDDDFGSGIFSGDDENVFEGYADLDADDAAVQFQREKAVEAERVSIPSQSGAVDRVPVASIVQGAPGPSKTERPVGPGAELLRHLHKGFMLYQQPAATRQAESAQIDVRFADVPAMAQVGHHLVKRCACPCIAGQSCACPFEFGPYMGRQLVVKGESGADTHVLWLKGIADGANKLYYSLQDQNYCVSCDGLHVQGASSHVYHLVGDVPGPVALALPDFETSHDFDHPCCKQRVSVCLQSGAVAVTEPSSNGCHVVYVPATGQRWTARCGGLVMMPMGADGREAGEPMFKTRGNTYTRLLPPGAAPDSMVQILLALDTMMKAMDG